MAKEILLCWFPPAKTYIPSPAMTILKESLVRNGFSCRIIYWNMLLEDTILSYFFNDKRALDDEVSLLSIFFSYLSIKYDDDLALLKQEILLRGLKPQYANIPGFSYKEHIKQCVLELEEKIKCICEEYNIQNSLFVGMSMGLFQWVPASIVSEIIKHNYQNTFIAIGGIGNSSLAEAYIKNFPFYDFAAWGEGEQEIVDLAKALSDGGCYTNIVQSYYRMDGLIVRSKNLKKKYINLDEWPYTDFSDFIHAYGNRTDSIIFPIEGARGCHWNQCNFCFLNQGYKYRTKSPKTISSEIRHNIEKYGVYDFSFLDNDIIGCDSNNFESLLNELISIKNEYPQFRIMLAEVITKGINQSTIKKMHLAGFFHVQIGYESPSDILLTKIHKKNTFTSNLFFIKWAFEYHINVGGMNILRGLLEESAENIYEGIKNLHFMRFFKNGRQFKHDISSLAINNMSKYYKKVNKDEIDTCYTDAVKEMLPKGYIEDSFNHYIFQYVRKYQESTWEYFSIIDRYYADNSFTYDVLQIDNSTIRYIEYCNSSEIHNIEFNVNELSWMILSLCNTTIRTVSEICESFSFDKELVIKEINDLNNIGLLYVGEGSRECISIINTLNLK